MIDYDRLFRFDSRVPYASAAATLVAELPALWLDEYAEMCAHAPNVLQFEVDGFEHLFDFTSDPGLVAPASATDDRLVAVFGYSRPQASSRDVSRMRGFLGGGLRGPDDSSMDKGHFIAHSAGGGTDVNLFPQRAELNRGWSDEGKVFRSMERFAVANVGTFVFARPIYSGASWQPVELEYGLLKPDLAVWVERFAN